MFGNGRAGWCLPLGAVALALIAASLASAAVPEEPADLRGTANDASDAALPDIGPDLRDDLKEPGERIEEEADPEKAQRDALEALEDAADYLDHAADPLLRQIAGTLESDPAALIEDRLLLPLHQTAGTVQKEVEGLLAPSEDQGPPEDPQVQGAVPAPQEPPGAAVWMAVGAAATATAIALFWLAGSSTGAGAAAGGAAASKEMRRLLPLASPLFTRFEKDTVLGHAKREAIYALIMTRPGATMADVARRTNLSRTAASHHLRLLEQQHLIVSKRMGRSRHYFENGGRFGRDQKDAYAVLRNGRSRDVARYIHEHPGAIQKHLCRDLGIQASVAHWHVRRLQEARLVDSVRQGRTVSYYPAAPLPPAA